MTAIASERIINRFGDLPIHYTAPVKASTTIYKGTLVAQDADGDACIPDNAAAEFIAGVAKHEALNGSGADGDLDVLIETGVFRFANSAGGDLLADADIGNLCYAVDNQTVAKTSTGGRIPAGVVIYVDSKGVLVWLTPLTRAVAAAAAGGGATAGDVQLLHSVRAVITGNEADLTTVSTTQDGLTLAVGDRVLLTGQSSGDENGIYTCGTPAGGNTALTRAVDFDESTEVAPGALVHVAEGTAGADSLFQLTTNEAIVVGTTSLTFAHIATRAHLASTANGLGASLVGIEDAGAFTTAADVEAALAELYQHLFSVSHMVPGTGLMNFREVDLNGDVANIAANGGVLASDTTPILRGDAAESQEINWAAGNTDKIAVQLPLPKDQVDGTADVTVDLVVSTGNTNADAATFTVESGWDGGALVVDTATDGSPGGTKHTITATIAAADIPDDPDNLTLILTPAAHGTDDVSLHGARVNYKQALLTA